MSTSLSQFTSSQLDELTNLLADRVTQRLKQQYRSMFAIKVEYEINTRRGCRHCGLFFDSDEDPEPKYFNLDDTMTEEDFDSEHNYLGDQSDFVLSSNKCDMQGCSGCQTYEIISATLVQRDTILSKLIF